MIHISYSNSKLGNIPSVNLPPIATCAHDAPCKSTCYACKGCFRFRNVKATMAENLEEYDRSPHDYFQTIADVCKTSKLFRFHAAGDIPSPTYFFHMCSLAKKIPDTKFLCFTKQYTTVNAYIRTFGSIPENLVVVFSAWGDYLPDNPHNLPVAYVRLKSGEGSEHIPEDATQCSGSCIKCVLGDCNCWTLKPGQSVVFNEH